MESMVGHGMWQEEKLQCKLWDGRIYGYHAQELTLVEEEPDGEWEKFLIGVRSPPFTERIRE